MSAAKRKRTDGAGEAGDAAVERAMEHERVSALEEQVIAQSQEVAGLEGRLTGLVNDKFEEVAKLINSMSPADRPTEAPKSERVGGEALEDALIVETSDGFATDMADLNDPAMQKRVASEAFMNEDVTVVLAEAQEEQFQSHHFNRVEIQANGRRFVFTRGVPLQVPRYVLEVLARAIRRNLRQVAVGDPDRSSQFRYLYNPVSRYPYAVVKDTSLGKAWLNMVEAQERG